MTPTLGRRNKRGINNMPPSTIAIMSGSDITSPWFTRTLTVTRSPSALTTASTVERVMRQTSMPASATLTPNSSALSTRAPSTRPAPTHPSTASTTGYSGGDTVRGNSPWNATACVGG